MSAHLKRLKIKSMILAAPFVSATHLTANNHISSTAAPSTSSANPSFAEFESGQARPIAMSPDRTRLFAVNTPAGVLEIFRTIVIAVGLTLGLLLVCAITIDRSSRSVINIDTVAARTEHSHTLNSGSEPATVRARELRNAELILVPAGTVQIGDDAGQPSERPAFQYTSHAFLMDRTPVTVAQFAAFVKDTGYKTDAERYGSAGVLDEKKGAWVAVKMATWRRPHGSRGTVAQTNHPVTQVSWFDANTFCSAYGLRLPTEFEWERAARMGQTPGGHVFKSGDPIKLSHRYLLNAWEGAFPLVNTAADGYQTTSPVGTFGSAPSGLTDMAGNVWEWTSSWYLPYGMPERQPAEAQRERVSRGGSFLCSAEFCQGYRASARNHTTPDTSLENIGFRCVVDSGHVPSLAGRVVQNPKHLAQGHSQTKTSGGMAQ
ncbi:MAG: formylglycine-generating enzyme family protein [Chloracidobacterium sp.]|nr:formylglycine-generating enzyme family protein [Chloracidobacterium sp.]